MMAQVRSACAALPSNRPTVATRVGMMRMVARATSACWSPWKAPRCYCDEHARVARDALLTKIAEQAGAYQDNGARDAAALLPCDEGRLPVTHLGLCQRLAMMVTARRPASAITDVISAVAGGAAPTAPVRRAGARATRHQVLTQPAPRLAAHFNSSRGQQDTSVEMMSVGSALWNSRLK